MTSTFEALLLKDSILKIFVTKRPTSLKKKLKKKKKKNT